MKKVKDMKKVLLTVFVAALFATASSTALAYDMFWFMNGGGSFDYGKAEFLSRLA